MQGLVQPSGSCSNGLFKNKCLKVHVTFYRFRYAKTPFFLFVTADNNCCSKLLRAKFTYNATSLYGQPGQSYQKKLNIWKLVCTFGLCKIWGFHINTAWDQSLLSLGNSYWCFKVHTAFTFKVKHSKKNACSCAGHRSLTHAQKKCRKAPLKNKPWVCSPLPPPLHRWKQHNTCPPTYKQHAY